MMFARDLMKPAIWLPLFLVGLGLTPARSPRATPPGQLLSSCRFRPGGPASVVADIVGPELGERLEQKVIIEHRSGADGIVGSEFVAKAPPDGYTLLLTTSSHVIHPATYAVLPFDTEKAFAPVSLLVASQYVLVVNPSLPIDSWRS